MGSALSKFYVKLNRRTVQQSTIKAKNDNESAGKLRKGISKDNTSEHDRTGSLPLEKARTKEKADKIRKKKETRDASTSPLEPFDFKRGSKEAQKNEIGKEELLDIEYDKEIKKLSSLKIDENIKTQSMVFEDTKQCLWNEMMANAQKSLDAVKQAGSGVLEEGNEKGGLPGQIEDRINSQPSITRSTMILDDGNAGAKVVIVVDSEISTRNLSCEHVNVNAEVNKTDTELSSGEKVTKDDDVDIKIATFNESKVEIANALLTDPIEENCSTESKDEQEEIALQGEWQIEQSKEVQQSCDKVVTNELSSVKEPSLEGQPWHEDQQNLKTTTGEKRVCDVTSHLNEAVSISMLIEDIEHMMDEEDVNNDSSCKDGNSDNAEEVQYIEQTGLLDNVNGCGVTVPTITETLTCDQDDNTLAEAENAEQVDVGLSDKPLSESINEVDGEIADVSSDFVPEAAESAFDSSSGKNNEEKCNETPSEDEKAATLPSEEPIANINVSDENVVAEIVSEEKDDGLPEIETNGNSNGHNDSVDYSDETFEDNDRFSIDTLDSSATKENASNLEMQADIVGGFSGAESTTEASVSGHDNIAKDEPNACLASTNEADSCSLIPSERSSNEAVDSNEAYVDGESEVPDNAEPMRGFSPAKCFDVSHDDNKTGSDSKLEIINDQKFTAIDDSCSEHASLPMKCLSDVEVLADGMGI